ncbi:MAG: PAS domain-containing sensor histidine kinase [Acidobacteriota bacterium]
MSKGPERGGRPARPRIRTDRVVLLGVFVLVLVFLGGYLTLRKAAHFSWPYLTNSVVLLSALLLTNAILVLTLLTLLMRNLIKALVERRRGILGSRFRTKLVFSLLLLWLVPSGIIFYTALHLIQRSIDRWFNEPMDRLTSASEEIVNSFYDEAQGRGAAFSRKVGERLRERGLLPPSADEDIHKAMGELLREYDLDLISVDLGEEPPFLVIDPLVPAAGDLPEVPSDRRRAAFAGEPFELTSEFRAGLLIQTGHPVRAGPGEPVSAVVTVGTYVPRNLAGLVRDVVRSNEEYRQIRAQKGLIKRLYILVFALITLLVLFSVTWVGLYLARRITEPIQSLAQGTRAISSGDLDYRVRVEAGDELGILVDSFNEMTAQLKAGKEMIERRNLELSRSNQELMERRRYIETLLQNISTGVVSLDRAGRVTTINRSAMSLLALESGPHPVGRRLAPLLPTPAREAVEAAVAEAAAGGRSGARQIELAVDRRALTLAVSASGLRGDAGGALGAILVIEDLTDLMRAQKIAAWREVARRLAHEIKNPLTPIQLSAERIHKKYAERGGDLDEIVEEGTAAIVREVSALKNLVDEFSRFARLPEPRPVPTALARVVEEAVSLYDGLHSRVTIVAECEPALPEILVDPEQMKRVLVNLLDNAIQATRGRGKVTVRARRDPASGTVHLEVADDGPGIRSEDRDRLFLPSFSTRKGGGLGLAIVHRIVTDHRGRIRVEDNPPHGARFVIELPAHAA